MIPYRWFLFIFIYFSFITQYITFLCWNPFVPIAKDVFGFAIVECSIIVAAIALGRLLFQIPGGLVADKYPAKRLLILSLLSLTIITWLISLKGSFPLMLVGQFFIGMAGVVVWPLSIKIIVDYFPVKERDFASGFFNTGTTIAVMVTNFCIPYIVYTYNWELAFQGISFLCFLNVLFIFFFMKDKKKTSEDNVIKKEPVSLKDVKALFSNKGFILCLIVYVGALYTSWGINTWVSSYLTHKILLPTSTVTMMMTSFGIFGCISMPLVGLATKGMPARRYNFLFCNFFFLATCLIIMSFTTSETLLWVLMICLGFGAFAHMGPLNLIIADFIDTKVMGTASALSIFVWQITVIFQSLTIGKVLDLKNTDISYFLMFLILSLGAYIACICVYKIKSILKKTQAY
ncbi:MFS transporter [Selenomonadales bacterium OttesenSCG-928-I06]|nr:MFS transporter [Selenomonadales bacterium OttesenSCG-928-I06]